MKLKYIYLFPSTDVSLRNPYPSAIISSIPSAKTNPSSCVHMFFNSFDYFGFFFFSDHVSIPSCLAISVNSFNKNFSKFYHLLLHIFIPLLILRKESMFYIHLFLHLQTAPQETVSPLKRTILFVEVLLESISLFFLLGPSTKTLSIFPSYFILNFLKYCFEETLVCEVCLFYFIINLSFHNSRFCSFSY